MPIVNRVVLGFTVGIVLMIAMGGISFRNTRRVVEDADWVEHTDRVLNGLGALLSDEQDLETGQRGFLVTGDERYLEPYAAGLERIAQNLKVLRDSTVDNPNQQRQLDRLEPLLRAKHDELAETISLRRTAGLDAAVAVVLTDVGKDIMDEIRSVIAEMEGEERTLRVERAAQSASTARQTRWFIVLGSLFGVTALAGISLLTIPGVIGIDRDIAARKLAEVALEKERQELERRVDERTADLSLANVELAATSRAKDEFLANMSHELRTPLNAILGSSESLQEGVYGPLNATQQDSVQLVEESGRHLLALINDVLDLAKVNVGRLELVMSPADLSDLCRTSLQFIKEPAQKKWLKVVTAFDEQVGTVQVDALRLKQILVNLLSNAVKFTPEGGTVGLEVTGDPEAEVVRLAVWDTGIGISAEDQPQLFQAFVQLDAGLDRNYEGTGLGLALVARMVELHGGSVSVESAGEAQGTRFTVALPWNSGVAPTEPASGTSVNAYKILVVEDSAATASQLVRYLEEWKTQAVVHTTGEGVVEVVLEHEPDLILLDLLLSGESGWDVLAKLKADERTRGRPVVIVSVVDERARAVASGAVDYIVKPVTREGLAAVLAAVGVASEEALALVVRGQDVKLPGDGPLILLAEDNEANITTVSDYLQAKGYRMVVARNGAEAVDLTSQERPALILMDVQMPDVDGLEATRQIREDPELAETPIVALTALAMAGDRERCLAAGANEYLSKPVSLRNLNVTISRLLDSAAD